MKETIKKICSKYKDNKLEILLSVLFLALFLVLNGPEIAKEASVTLKQSGSSNGMASETGDEAPESSESEDGESEDGESEDGESESKADGKDNGKSSDSTAKADGESETQSESEKVLTREDEKRQERRTLSQLGNGFVIPMKMPEDMTEEPVWYDLSDTKQLEGYVLLSPTQAKWYDVTLKIPDAVKDFEEGKQPFPILEQVVQNKLAEYDGEWSVYVKNLSTDESFVVNDRAMKSASVMKLFIMGTVYKAFDAGELERTDEIMSLVNNMIIYSDNEASNQLLYYLGGGSYEAGIAKVDTFIRDYGFSDMTVEYNGFNNPATVTGSGNYNQVSAKDCGKLLEDIYRRNWVSRSVSNEMETLLLSQNTRYKIPAGLPDGVLCGNKTGEMDTTENDAAIVFAEDCDYILVVLSSDWSSKDTAIFRIQDISGMVYDFLN